LPLCKKDAKENSYVTQKLTQMSPTSHPVSHPG
jgi:hypothetical protein